ncbi:MAG: hypothetical protein ABIF11_08655 [Nitrospirota bacterium]
MKKLRNLLVTMFVLSVIVTPISAWAFDNLCWNINGWYIKVAATPAGVYGGAQMYTLNGKGPSGPVSGTAIVPLSGGTITVSVQLLQASPIAYAVMHQATLNSTTLCGTGNWRWFDSSNQGTSIWTWTTPPPLSPAKGEETEGDLVSAGRK